MVDTLISYHRGGYVYHEGENLFSKFTTDGATGHSGGDSSPESIGEQNKIQFQHVHALFKEML